MHIPINFGFCSIRDRTPKRWNINLILHTYSSVASAVVSVSMSAVSMGSNSEVLVVKDGVRVLDGVFGWDSEVFLLDVDVDGWVLSNEWHFLVNSVGFEFPDSEFSDVGDFIWYLDLSSVALEILGHVWLLNGNSEEGLVPLSLFEFVLDGEWLLLVLGHWNLRRCDEWHLLDDGVVNSLGDFVWDGE